MKNERLFREYMVALSEVHGKVISALLHSIYWKTLEPYTDEECEQAFKELTLSSRFFPKPADFIEVLRGKADDQATRAWIMAIETVRRVGPYQSIRFADPVIHGVLKFMGGWSAAGDWSKDELKWKQKEFERLYAIMAKGGNHPDYLPGVHEIDNAANGYEVKPEVVRIGFDEKVKEIAA